jgi:hypothetical protein
MKNKEGKMTRKLMAAVVLTVAITVTGAETDAPKIGEPVKLDTPVVFIGDSMMKMLGKGMEKAFKAKEVTPAESFSSLGSGLARPSIFNWPTKAKELCERVKPKTAFISLGTNDRQNLESRTGSMAVVGTDEWRVEYKCRIEELLDALYTSGVTHVVWMLTPPMKSEGNEQHSQLVAGIVAEIAGDEKYRDRFHRYDMGKVLTIRPGRYTQTIISKTGAAVTVRDTDGVHLSFPGAKIVAEDVLRTYWPEKK